METMDDLLQATRHLQAMMQAHYGEEYRRKWSGFTPREMAQLWASKFSNAGIDVATIRALGDRLQWEHPPTLPVVVDELQDLQTLLRREAQARAIELRLPAPADLARPDSPAVIAFRAELDRFMQRRVVA